MGKQSTGKSYFLNHLTGSSFAISGARCTDGAWMSVRFLPNVAMLVVIDFEGLGSFERTEQDDVFLSVLNASVSMLTIFRMEMRLDKEIDELFSKFQKGSQLIKNDPRLFRGKLYMSVKDVNPNDQRGVVGEFVTKFQRLLAANKEQNFLTEMYAGQVDINCSPPLGTVGYYQSLSQAQCYIAADLCENPKAGFPSGKAFLDCVRLLLAKISILDWRDTLGWEDPCGSAQEREAFGKCAYRCDAADHDGKQASYCVLPVWHSPAAKPSTGPDSFSYVSGHKFECTHVTSGNKMHHIFVLDASGSMKGEAWRDLKSAFRKYVRNRINDGGTLDLVTMITFDGTASIEWEAQNITTTTRSEAPFRGGWTLFAAALRAANEVLSCFAFEMFKPIVVFFSDGHPSDAHDGEVVAAHVAETYAKYGLEAFVVGFGSVNLPVLERMAERLGGSYYHALDGTELQSTFQSISASLGTRASLALTRSLHEVCCAVCQADLAVEATVALTPCGHELHQRCLRRLVECGTDGKASQCPTCRHDIQTE